jgi:hypothetical protein
MHPEIKVCRGKIILAELFGDCMRDPALGSRGRTLYIQYNLTYPWIFTFIATTESVDSSIPLYLPKHVILFMFILSRVIELL